MLTVVWLESALTDLEIITDYIAEHNPDAAVRLRHTLAACAERIASFPYMYETGRVPGTREAIAHPNYMLLHRITAHSVEIMRVLHARQQYP